MLDAKTWLDIKIVGVGSYVNNNLLALKNTTNIKVLNELGQDDFDKEGLYYNQGENKYHVYNRTVTQFLSGSWNKGDHAVGLSLGGYSYTSVRSFNDPIANFVENGVSSFVQQHLKDYKLKNFKVTSIAYGELKLSYANTII